MAQREEQELASRGEKLAAWKKLGWEAYPASFHRTHAASEVQELAKGKVQELTGAEVPKGTSVIVAGRLMTIRPHGSLWFATLQDTSGTVQVAGVQESSGEKVWQVLELLDRGDIIG